MEEGWGKFKQHDEAGERCCWHSLVASQVTDLVCALVLWRVLFEQIADNDSLVFVFFMVKTQVCVCANVQIR